MHSTETFLLSRVYNSPKFCVATLRDKAEFYAPEIEDRVGGIIIPEFCNSVILFETFFLLTTFER